MFDRDGPRDSQTLYREDTGPPKHIAVYLSEEETIKLCKICDIENRSRSNFIRYVLNNYFRRNYKNITGKQ